VRARLLLEPRDLVDTGEIWRYYRGEEALRPFTFTCPAGFTSDPLGGMCSG
jgi:hypothetical protein